MLNEASIVCIAKNEESFINEWVYYHIKLGFSFFCYFFVFFCYLII